VFEHRRDREDVPLGDHETASFDPMRDRVVGEPELPQLLPRKPVGLLARI
jgi:hypothetical protein